MKYSQPPSEWHDYINFTDKILSSEKLSPFLLSHPFLHPTKPTFYILKKLYYLKNTYHYRKFLRRLAFYYYCLCAILDILKQYLFYDKKTNQKLLSFYKKNYDYIFISHLNNEERLNKEIDDYYGEIINILTKKNKKVLLILIPHCSYKKVSRGNFLNKRRDFDTYIFNNKYVCGRDKVNFFNSTIKMRYKFLFMAKSSKAFERKLYEETADTFLYPSYLLNLFCGVQLKNILKMNTNSKLITTYEGHGWERLFYYQASLTSKKIKSIGFQHTLFFKFNHSLTRLINKSCDPDLILCSGELSRLSLHKKLSDKVRVDLIGSPKVPKFKSIKNKKKDCILIVPSGEEEEAYSLTKFAYNFAQKNKQYNILIRYHPVISKKFKRNFNHKISNFKISDKTIKEDCQISKWVIYSSSTAIFEAIYQGCIPIRLSLDLVSKLSDPLWQIKTEYIFKINTEKELTKIIKKTNNLKYQINSSKSLYFLISKLCSKLKINTLESF